MKMYLELDGKIGGVGAVSSYPFDVPKFIQESGSLLWEFKGGNFNDPANWATYELAIDPIEKVKSDQIFGMELFNKIVAGRKSTTYEEDRAFVETVQIIRMFFNTGYFESAKTEILKVLDPSQISDELKQELIKQIDDFLGSKTA